ncbi:MAG: methyltransferase [Pseudorhodobacter sp.]|nr:methyltransferase [Pseudorhodobacter sp.]
MADAADVPSKARAPARPLRDRLIGVFASRGFQRFAARVPGLRRIARAEGEAIFDLVAGFVHSQVLMALVELDVLRKVQDRPQSVEALARSCGLAVDRMQVLIRAGASLHLLHLGRDGQVGLTLRGASVLSVPGLEAMILHHRAFYRDMADPVALLQGGSQTELSQFWPYVFGAAGAVDPKVTAQYSSLMADSQVLVAEDTLRMVDFSQFRRVLDIGGGTGAFLSALGAACPQVGRMLFDLPVVLDGMRKTPLSGSVSTLIDSQVALHPGSFRDDPLPAGADCITLNRVLYDHSDTTVAALLAKVHGALPEGGSVVISEPMLGGSTPNRATDAYFALYTLAMQTGRTRSGAEIGALLAAAGFRDVRILPGYRPFVTSVVTARR